MAQQEKDPRIEVEVRRRLTEAAAAGGVPHSRASLEVLYLLPGQFLDAYTGLFDAALKLPDSPQGGTTQAGELGKANSNDALRGTHKGLRVDSSAEAGVGAHVGGGTPKKGPGGWHVRDSRALEIKARIDKRLRGIGREIRQELAGAQDDGRDADGRQNSSGSGTGDGPSRCAGCGRIAQADWRWCPHCGARFRAAGGSNGEKGPERP